MAKGKDRICQTFHKQTKGMEEQVGVEFYICNIAARKSTI